MNWETRCTQICVLMGDTWWTSLELSWLMSVSHRTAGRWLIRLTREGKAKRQTYFYCSLSYTWLYKIVNPIAQKKVS